jgi:hypothetical protein
LAECGISTKELHSGAVWKPSELAFGLAMILFWAPNKTREGNDKSAVLLEASVFFPHLSLLLT